MYTLKQLEQGIEFPEHITPQEARRVWLQFRLANGRKAAAPLMSVDGNVKLSKGTERIFGLSLAPANVASGNWFTILRELVRLRVNVCPKSTPQCRRGCLNTAGRGLYDKVQEGRRLRTAFLFLYPQHFLRLLDDELRRARFSRLNVFSNIRWEKVAPWLFDRHKECQFYDYTKRDEQLGDMPANYHLTFSASERTTEEDVAEMVGRGVNVTVVMSPTRGKPLPATFAGCTVLDGDVHDQRWEDPVGVVVGLRAKGKMRDKSFLGGFVKEVQ